MKVHKQAVTSFFLLAAFVTPVFTSALGFGTINSAGTTYATVADTAGMTDYSFGEILANVMYWLMGILGIGAIVTFVIAGILYLVAGGDEGKTDNAKQMMVYALIGVVVALVGFVAVQTVANLTGSAAGTLTTY